MKKHLLFTTSIFVSGMLCAQVNKPASRIPSRIANMAIPVVNISGETAPINAAVSNGPSANTTTLKTSVVTSSIIGSTYYDLQSNSSVADRIVVNNDGTIATAWTMDLTGVNTYSLRGTGYNYFNGSTWGPAPTARIENARVGWGEIVNTRSGRELVLSHGVNAAGALNLASRPVKGTGAWANSITAVATATAGGNFWPRFVNTGDTVYALAVTQATSTAGAAMYQGLNGAVVFSRSKDAGVTWDIVNQVPAGLTSATNLGFGGDKYAIAARGTTVAVVAGGFTNDLTLSKSTDGGVTWTSTTVLQFPITKFNYVTTTSDANNDGTADTLRTNDGAVAVGLDMNGMAYVYYGDMRVLVTTPNTLNYFPGTDGLKMWNETMPANVGGFYVAAIQDLGEQGTIFFPTPATTGGLSFGRWQVSLTSHPSVAFDAQNNMYLSYDSVVDSLIAFTGSNDKLLRHTYIIKSCDGGQNWTDPLDLVETGQGIEYETVFGSMAKNVDGNVHIIYQRDLAPGNGIPGTTASPNPDETENFGSGVPNDIMYIKVPTVDMSCTSVTGIKNSSSVANLSFYPNPASSNGTIEVTLKENSKMEIVIMNSVGQKVYSTSLTGNAGSNKVDVNLSNLSNGLYFYQVKIDNNKPVTNKFVVGK